MTHLEMVYFLTLSGYHLNYYQIINNFNQELIEFMARKEGYIWCNKRGLWLYNSMAIVN